MLPVPCCYFHHHCAPLVDDDDVVAEEEDEEAWFLGLHCLYCFPPQCREEVVTVCLSISCA